MRLFCHLDKNSHLAQHSKQYFQHLLNSTVNNIEVKVFYYSLRYFNRKRRDRYNSTAKQIQLLPGTPISHITVSVQVPPDHSTLFLLLSLGLPQVAEPLPHALDTHFEFPTPDLGVPSCFAGMLGVNTSIEGEPLTLFIYKSKYF